MYRIVNWNEHFENNRTRELKVLHWVPVPNKHDGDGYTDLLDHVDGPAHYGAWCAIIGVASKCEPRGTLLRDGARPHDARTLARMTHFPVAAMEGALGRLVHPIGWLEVVPDPVPQNGVTAIPQESATAPHEGAGIPQASALNGTEGNRTEGNGIELPVRSPNGVPSPLKMSDGSEIKPFDTSNVNWETVAAWAEAVGRKIPPRTKDDRRMWLRLSVLAQVLFSEEWLMDGTEAVVHAKATKRTKQAHFMGVMKSKTKRDHGLPASDFLVMLRSIEIPKEVWKSSVLEIPK